MRQVPELQGSIEISAPVDHVWELVSDVRRMHEWSPQVESTRLRAGFEAVCLGAQFTNRNVHDDLVWTTHAEVVRYEPGRELAFRVEENWTVWSFLVEPTAAGTLLTQRREAPDGISELSHELTEGFMGGREAFAERMRQGSRQTLEALKAAAEASS